MTSGRLFFASAALLALVAAGCGAPDADQRRVGRNAYVDTSNQQLSVCGRIIVDVIGEPATATPATGRPPQVTRLARGALYQGMEDNDLRGYLDGSFKEGWNQVGQTHLRLGRRARNPAFGEYELFRNLERWDDLGLPADARIIEAEIELALESGPPYAVDVAVYAVRKDFNPGAGGIYGDNNSPPAPGEVWWVDARHGELAWTIAGAGHASDTDPEADTGARPLALARYAPQAGQLRFTSPALGSYIEDRIAADEPILLLFKLTDPYEDSIGSMLEIWSANYGVDGSPRRPTLSLKWLPRQVVRSEEYRLWLEPGRSLELPAIPVADGHRLAASFVPDDESSSCGQQPWLEYALGDGSFARLVRPVSADGGLVRLRATAAEEPVRLGSEAVFRIRDTWIPVGEPESHDVIFTFTAPDGEILEITATYVGDYTWEARVAADRLGRWSYQWQHALSGKPLASEVRVFDVVARELREVEAGLTLLEAAIESSGAAARSHEMLPFELAFMRLERAAMTLLVDGPPPPHKADEIRHKIKQLREVISGRPVPEEFTPAPIRAREAEIE